MSRFESMLAHPAGKGIPESPEVVQARMDAEACAVGSLNHVAASPPPVRREVPEWVGDCGLVAFGLGMLAGIVAAALVDAGWLV